MRAPGNELEQLRRLLLTPERKQLEDLRERVLDAPRRAEDVAEILPQAIATGHARGKQLSRALQAPVAEALGNAIKADPVPVADALFPVIGPAIRKSIAHALESFTENLNRTLEHSLSPKGLRWRLEAARSGVPFSQVVLKHTLRYRVEEAFLIHRESGLLIAHVSDGQSGAQDKDAVSGMLSAVQDFVRDSFLGEQQGDLDQVDIGEHRLWLLRGPHAMLACLIRGVAPRELRGELAAVLEQIHKDYPSALAGFAGDRSALPGVELVLRECLKSQRVDGAGAAGKGRAGWLMVILGLALLVLLALLVARWIQASSLAGSADDLAQGLRAQPGYALTGVTEEDGVWTFRGLRDPLAEPAEGLVQRAGLTPAQVRFEWSPYQALEPALILRRARASLKVPETVTLEYEGGTLILSGIAGSEWFDRVSQNRGWPAGVEQLNSDALQIEVPPAPDPPAEPPPTPPPAPDVMPDALQPLQRLEIPFVTLHHFAPGAGASLDQAAALIRELVERHGDSVLRIDIVGGGDGTGTASRNRSVRRMRAQVVKGALIRRGVEGAVLSTTASPLAEPPRPDPALRRVRFAVHLATQPADPTDD